jgi:hypothetical protein
MFFCARIGWEPIDLRRKESGCQQKSESGERPQASSSAPGRLVHSVRVLTGILVLLVAAGTSRAVLAQDSWNFANEIPCATAPVFGVPFTQCWASNVRTFRVGNVQSWRLTYTDTKSEVAIGLYRLVEAHGVGGMSAVAGSTAIDWLRTADALKNVTAGGSGWTLNGSQGGDHYVAFKKAQRQCIAFVRNGPAVGGQINWILGAAFCRESASPIPSSELQFIADAVQVRD